MNHYFTNSNIEHNLKKIEVNINNQKFIYTTDNGVFSKNGLDFGTRTLLENLPLEELNGKVLDIGCGYGPIGIYVAKMTDCLVDMIDINLRSLDLALKNSVTNDVKVNVFESDIYSNVSNKYNYIITNPPIRVGKKILYSILFEAEKHLLPNGELWLVINKDQGAKSLVKDLEEKYEVSVITKNKGFYVIRAKKTIKIKLIS